MTLQQTLIIPLCLAYLEGKLKLTVGSKVNLSSVQLSLYRGVLTIEVFIFQSVYIGMFECNSFVFSTKKIIGIATVSRAAHTIAQTRELACTKIVIPEVMARGKRYMFLTLWRFFVKSFMYACA